MQCLRLGVATSLRPALTSVTPAASAGRNISSRITACISAAAHQTADSRHLSAPTEAHTQLLAQILASLAQQGDCICLHGDVGAGKSVFSRAFVRAAYDDDMLPVPSPTYLLQNIYDDCEGPPIHHFDLYRLSRPADLQRIGWSESVRSAICLVEWPDRLGDQCPEERLDIHVSIVDEASSSPDTAGSRASEPDQDEWQWLDDQPRLLQFTACGQSWRRRIATVVHEFETRMVDHASE